KRERVTEPGADLVEPAAGERLANGIGQGERAADLPEGGIADAQVLFEPGTEKAEGLAIDVVDGGAEKKQGADHKAISPNAMLGRRLILKRQRGLVGRHGREFKRKTFADAKKKTSLGRPIRFDRES